MKYIIAGLGRFGLSLAKSLTAQGHQVIGLDNNMQLVERYKDEMAITICLDICDEAAMRDLPIKDTDTLIVAIGGDEGTNIIATALCKNLGAKRIVSRAISRLHEQVLTAMSVDEIIRPEVEAAKRCSQLLTTNDH